MLALATNKAVHRFCLNAYGTWGCGITPYKSLIMPESRDRFVSSDLFGADSCYFWGASRNFHGKMSCEHVFSMMGRFSRDGMMDFGSGVDPNKHGFQKFFAWL